jgi:hypothetical protein
MGIDRVWTQAQQLRNFFGCFQLGNKLRQFALGRLGGS